MSENVQKLSRLMYYNPFIKFTENDKIRMNIEAIDLFCGVGGLTHGLEKSGIKVLVGYDIDPACRYPYQTNNSASFVEKNIVETEPEDLLGCYSPDALKMLAGCAPCQPFSKYTQHLPKDERWSLLYSFLRLIEGVQPDLITMENVPEIKRHKVYHDFEASLLRQGYFVWSQVVFCPDYGIAQNRKRLVLLASKFADITLIQPTHDKSNYCTVRDVISQLPPISAGQKNLHDPIHVANKLTEINLKRIRASKSGGTWRDWSEDLKLTCHGRSTGKGYVSVYGRMKWDEPSPTITTQAYNYGSGRFGHPEQDRAITLREAALLQSFPENYQFIDPKEKDFRRIEISRLIGNAVPVKLAEVIGQSMITHLASLSSLVDSDNQ